MIYSTITSPLHLKNSGEKPKRDICDIRLSYSKTFEFEIFSKVVFLCMYTDTDVATKHLSRRCTQVSNDKDGIGRFIIHL